MDEVGHALALAIGAGILAHFAQVEPPKPSAPAPARPAAPAVPSALVPPPARAPIAGLRGFESRSRLDYAAQPGRAHELRATYVFPDRVRWWISTRDGLRRMRYQYGQHVLSIEPQQTESVEFRAEDRAALLAAFEMRRALFLWPDDRKWTGEGASRQCKLANGDELRVKLAGKPERPVELEYKAARGEFNDTFRAITWRIEGKRAWPAAFEVWNGAELSWRETVEAVDVETRFVDSYFVPPDRRGVAGVPVDGIRDLDIPPVCARRIELPAETTWDAARAERKRLFELPRNGLPEIEPFSTFEVRSDGGPAAILLRLAHVPERVPDGYTLLPDRLGVATSVTGLVEVKAGVLKRLAARLPAGAVAGRPYVRFDGATPEPGVVVVLPVE